MSHPPIRPFASFLLAATHPSRFPRASVPEVALVGRSNVGKSSLLNALVGSRVARVSRTPGRTREVHFYDVRLQSSKAPVAFRLVDLPGYGHARVPRTVMDTWSSFVEPYLFGRTVLSLCALLVDLSIPPQPSDQEMARALLSAGRSLVLVATKADRVALSRREWVLRTFRDSFGVPPMLVSARTGAGVADLWEVMVQVRDSGS